MNRIDGAGPARTSGHVEGIDKDADRNSTRQPRMKTQADTIELSSEARKLIEDPDDIDAARGVVLDAAKKKLLSGELLNTDALRRAAENLLASGDLGKVDG